MMKYLVILMSSASPSYCHYSHNSTKEDLISLESLKSGINFAFRENLSIQVVFPDFALPESYIDYLSKLDITSVASGKSPIDADIIVLEGIEELLGILEDKSYIVRTSKASFFKNYETICGLETYPQRISIVFSDIESFSEDDFVSYQKALADITGAFEKKFLGGQYPQLSIVTDRLFLEAMNNCGAGSECITLAPDGKFYLCPGYYYDNSDSVGSPTDGLSIPNAYLYKIETSPMCRNCDAYNCRRCVWLNQKLTLEVCIPSHQQCVVSHIERNAAKALRDSVVRQNPLYEFPEIKEIEYLDPFDNRKNFK